MYFDPAIVQLPRDAMFVDAGAYTGDTVDEFVAFVKGEYGRILSFEPNEANYRMLKKSVAGHNYTGVETYPYGLYDKKATLFFDVSSDVAARVSEEGTEKIECVPLDEVLRGGREPVHMIKMDIEGSELPALEGARESVKRWKLILAVCAYHEPDDFFTIPQKIKALEPGYQIYFRQYELSSEETVCYAVYPKEEGR